MYEDECKLTLKNKATEYTVKSIRAARVLCEPDVHYLIYEINIERLKEVEAFGIKFDLPGEDGVVKKKALRSITPKTINLNGSWVFDITDHMKEIEPLFPGLIFG